MNIHYCLFKILGKNQRRRRTHGWTDTRTDRCENSIPPQSLQGGGGGGGGGGIITLNTNKNTENIFCD